MMKKLIAGAALLALSAASALAADLPARMPAKAPVAVSPAYNWSGWYVGINGGGAWGYSDWTNFVASKRDTASLRLERFLSLRRLAKSFGK